MHLNLAGLKLLLGNWRRADSEHGPARFDLRSTQNDQFEIDHNGRFYWEGAFWRSLQGYTEWRICGT